MSTNEHPTALDLAQTATALQAAFSDKCEADPQYHFAFLSKISPEQKNSIKSNADAFFLAVSLDFRETQDELTTLYNLASEAVKFHEENTQILCDVMGEDHLRTLIPSNVYCEELQDAFEEHKAHTLARLFAPK